MITLTLCSNKSYKFLSIQRFEKFMSIFLTSQILQIAMSGVPVILVLHQNAPKTGKNEQKNNQIHTFS